MNVFWNSKRLVHILFAGCILFFGGCGPSNGGGGFPTGTPSGSTTTTTSPVTNTPPSSTLPPISCNGVKLGTYAWNQYYWRGTDNSLLDFLDSDMGRQWACGDVSINIADYTNPDQIHESGELVQFIQQYRLRVRNFDTVVWLTYGDVVEKNTAALIQFTRTFFKWAAAIPADVAASMGTIGVSYDVEHFDPSATEQVLKLARELRTQTNFAGGKILIQHTIEGAPNVEGTDFVMKYADSALAMVYRNFMHDPTGRYSDSDNILQRLIWMLTQQCTHCLDDGYASSQYVAKITVMVENSCEMGAGCGKLSFCAHDSASEGATYVLSTLQAMYAQLLSSGSVTQTQFSRLFSTSTPYTSGHWEWYRCAAPFSSAFNFGNCTMYHQLAEGCRAQ